MITQACFQYLEGLGNLADWVEVIVVRVDVGKRGERIKQEIFSTLVLSLPQPVPRFQNTKLKEEIHVRYQLSEEGLCVEDLAILFLAHTKERLENAANEARAWRDDFIVDVSKIHIPAS